VTSDGLLGLWRGSTASVIRNVSGVGMYMIIIVVSSADHGNALTIPRCSEYNDLEVDSL